MPNTNTALKNETTPVSRFADVPVGGTIKYAEFVNPDSAGVHNGQAYNTLYDGLLARSIDPIESLLGIVPRPAEFEHALDEQGIDFGDIFFEVVEAPAADVEPVAEGENDIPGNLKTDTDGLGETLSYWVARLSNPDNAFVSDDGGDTYNVVEVTFTRVL